MQLSAQYQEGFAIDDELFRAPNLLQMGQRRVQIRSLRGRKQGPRNRACKYEDAKPSQ